MILLVSLLCFFFCFLPAFPFLPSGHIHTHTLYWHSRPFGCSVLIASYEDDSGPMLAAIEPSGVCYRYFGVAIGKYKQGSSSELEKLDFTKITCREAVKEIARILYKLHDEVKDKEMEVELSWVCDESKRLHVRVPEEVRAEAVKLALEAKRKEEMDDDDDDDDEKKEATQ